MADNQDKGDELPREQLAQRTKHTYQGWGAVPAGLVARMALAREGLSIPAGVSPGASVYARKPPDRQGYAYFDLYRREDAVRRPLARMISISVDRLTSAKNTLSPNGRSSLRSAGPD
jgi:hypothetical protein